MELVQKVDETRALIKDKGDLINQLKKIAGTWRRESSKQSRCLKEIKYMDCIKVDMRISVDKFYIEENNALGEMKNLASEI